MRIIKDNFKESQGYIRCRNCGSILEIFSIDVAFDSSGKYYICGCCARKQYFTGADLKSRKRMMEENNE